MKGYRLVPREAIQHEVFPHREARRRFFDACRSTGFKLHAIKPFDLYEKRPLQVQFGLSEAECLVTWVDDNYFSMSYAWVLGEIDQSRERDLRAVLDAISAAEVCALWARGAPNAVPRALVHAAGLLMPDAGDPELAACIMAAARAGDAVIRHAALTAMACRPLASYRAVLREMIEDADHGVQQRAASVERLL